MNTNKAAINLYNKMAEINQNYTSNCYYSSGRPIKIDPTIIIQDIESKLLLTKKDIVLDAGCGTGVVTIPLSYKVGHIHALDAGSNVLLKLEKNCKTKGVFNVTTVNSLVNKIPYQDNFFDNVLMYAVIHYLDGLEQVESCIKELIRVCKPGGKILIAEIPEEVAIKEFRQTEKTPEELDILKNFNKKRVQYDSFMKRIDQVQPASDMITLKGDILIKISKKNGCDSELLKQDIRQPFSFTRRDLLIHVPEL